MPFDNFQAALCIAFHYPYLSLRLTEVETLESVSQNFKRRFQFFNLVSDFLSR